MIPSRCFAIALIASSCADYAIGASFECRHFQRFSTRGIQRPEPPSCIELRFNEYNFQTCKFEMEDYLSQIDSYTACLAAESKDAVREFNDKVRSFNCNARGTFC